MEGERPIGSGQTADVFALDDGWVLKQFETGVPADVARREAENTRLAHEAGLAVPAVREVTSVDGRPAIVYDRVEGPTIRSRLAARPWTLRRNARRLAAVHAAIHEVRPSGLRSLREKLSRQIREASGLPSETRRRVLAELESLPRGDALYHGDFHPGNVLLAESGPVVIDWLDAARGPPAADVARTSVVLRYAGRREGRVSSMGLRLFRRWYLRRYRSETGVSRDAVRAWELPIAAARVAESVPEEPRLRSFVDSRLAEE